MGTPEIFSMAEYQKRKALSASGIDLLLNECPWKFWQLSPWNPDFKPKHSLEFDIGTSAHLAILEPDQYDERIVRIPYNDYKTAAARELRDASYAAEKTPLTLPQEQMLGILATALWEQAGSYFCDGMAEKSLMWDWDGVPCKARPDYLIPQRGLIIDLKTTTTCNPHVIQRKAYREGWHIRAPWYIEGYDRVFETKPERYIFVVIETASPHLVQTFEMDQEAMLRGRMLIRHGLDLFRHCLEQNEWPAYREGTIKLSLPVWAEYGLADREASGEFNERYLQG